MQGIKALIADKEAKIALLQRHIDQLRAMAAEEVGMILRRRRRGEAAGEPKKGSRIAQVLAYLERHSGPVRMRDLGEALGVKPGLLSGQVSHYIAKGIITREGRGTIRLKAKAKAKATKPTRSKAKSGSKAKTAKGNGRAGAILSYLQTHPGPHKSGDVRAALGFTTEQFWGSLSHHLKAGHVVRPEPGRIALGATAGGAH